MPLPFIIGGIAAVAGVAGIGTGIKGAAKMKEANDTIKAAESRHKSNIDRFERVSGITNEVMDQLGKIELQILNSFEEFSTLIEKIQNRPQFKQYNKDGIVLPQYDKESLTNVSVGAGVLLGGLGGAAVGTAGGFAAAGATTSAVMALGTASTGTAIASLSGVAATNATLAALGGGAMAAGGGGMALGSTVLGAATLGVGLLVGGVIFNFTGSKLSSKADEAYEQMEKAELTINKICIYLSELEYSGQIFKRAIVSVNDVYKEHFGFISYVIHKMNKTDWNDFTDQERRATENTILLVGLLYKMCQVNLVKKSESSEGVNSVNKEDIRNAISESEEIVKCIK
ncbi:MAG: hypothetical protein RR657_04405 [Peptostreptococcaceae bacterium]